MDTQPIAVSQLLASADRLVAAAGVVAFVVPQTDTPPPPSPPTPVHAAPISIYRPVDVVQLQGSTDDGVRTVYRAAVPGYSQSYAPEAPNADVAGSVVSPGAGTGREIISQVTPVAQSPSHEAMANAEAHLQRRIILVVA